MRLFRIFRCRWFHGESHRLLCATTWFDHWECRKCDRNWYVSNK